MSEEEEELAHSQQGALENEIFGASESSSENEARDVDEPESSSSDNESRQSEEGSESEDTSSKRSSHHYRYNFVTE